MNRNIKISLLSLLVLIGSINAVVQNEEINVALPLAFNSWSPEVQKQYMAINSYVQGLIDEVAGKTTEQKQTAAQNFMNDLANLVRTAKSEQPMQSVRFLYGGDEIKPVEFASKPQTMTEMFTDLAIVAQPVVALIIKQINQQTTTIKLQNYMKFLDRVFSGFTMEQGNQIQSAYQNYYSELLSKK